MSNPKPLTLEISLDSLRHLGMNLYSSLPPVLSELVANAYDARARRVDITVADDRVTIGDDGIQDPNIQCVCLVGKLPTIGSEEEGALLAGGTKIRTYDSVISDSCKRFADYIEAEKKFGRIQGILAKLDRV